MVAYPPIPDQIPGGEYGLTSGAGLTGLYAAIANRNNARVDIPVIGDSITEGQGATAMTSRWIANANRAARAAYPTTANGSSGGIGFIPIASTGETTYAWPVTLVSGSVATVDLGPVRLLSQVTAAASWTWTAPAGTSSVKVAYFDGPAGTFSWKVGAGAATNIAYAGTLTDKLSADIAITSGQVLTIAWVSGTIAIDGLVHYAADEASGITFHGCGHFGWQCGSTQVNAWNQPQSLALDWVQAYGMFDNLAAIGIMLGGIDAAAGSAAVFAANLKAFVNLLRTDPTARLPASLPLLLIIPYQVNEAFVDAGGWAAYAAAIRGVQAATPFSHVIDLNYRMPSVASNFGGGELYADTLHPSNLGHALLGEIAASGLRIA